MTQEGTRSGKFAGKPEAGIGRSPLLSGGGTFLSPRPRTSHHGFAPGMPATEMGPQGSQQVFRRLGLAAALQGSRRRGRRIQPIHWVSGSGGRKTPAPVRRGDFPVPPSSDPHHGFAPGMPATEMDPQGSQQVFRRLGLAAALQGSRRGRRIQPIQRVSGSGGRKTPAPGQPTRRLGRSSSEG